METCAPGKCSLRFAGGSTFTTCNDSNSRRVSQDEQQRPMSSKYLTVGVIPSTNTLSDT